MSDLLQHGGEIPDSARKRLEEMRGAGAEGRAFFTSDLSVNEFLLVEQAGFEPTGFVMGSSFFHTGIQWTVQPFQNYELDVLTQALYHARAYAMARMEEEAAILDADGVVGVRLEIGKHAWAESMVEFNAVGTAVRHRSEEGRAFRKPTGRPFTSDLSGQEFFTLLRTGCRPVELAMGNCVYHVGRRGLRQALSQMGRNTEMPNYTQALYDARELALERMQADAEMVKAHGIVGVKVTQQNHGWDSHVLEFFALGTAVVRVGPPPAVAEPTFVLPLSDPAPPVISVPVPGFPATASGGGE